MDVGPAKNFFFGGEWFLDPPGGETSLAFLRGEREIQENIHKKNQGGHERRQKCCFFGPKKSFFRPPPAASQSKGGTVVNTLFV